MAETIVNGTPDTRSRVRLSVAIGPRTLWVTRVGLGRGHVDARTNLTNATTIEAEDLSRASLERAFQMVQTQLGIGAATLDIAILPPLVQARHLVLPRLRLDELRRVLTHAAGKYFFGAREPHTVGVRKIGRGRGSPVRVFAVAAPTQLIDAMFEAAGAVGWQIDTVLSAYDVWARAVREALPRDRRPSWLVHATRDFMEGIALDDGRPTLVRRSVGGQIGISSVLSWVSADDEDTPPPHAPRVAVVGDNDTRRRLSDGLTSAGVSVVEPTGADFQEPGTLAAACVERTHGVELMPPAVREMRVRHARRLTVGLGVAAAAVITIAAFAELWGARRELNALERERSAIHQQVEAALSEREVLLELNERLTVLGLAETTAPRWSRVLATVSANLPRDAHLLAFRASADSLVLEGLADRAAGVFEAMQAAPDIVGVRARAPIRRELLSGNRAIERFALGAQLSRNIPSEEPQ